jgi:hypothetical protein
VKDNKEFNNGNKEKMLIKSSYYNLVARKVIKDHLSHLNRRNNHQKGQQEREHLNKLKRKMKKRMTQIQMKISLIKRCKIKMM